MTSQIIVTAVFAVESMDSVGAGIFASRRQIPGHPCSAWHAGLVLPLMIPIELISQAGSADLVGGGCLRT